MIVALIDNGSFEPAAHRNLRALADALGRRVGVQVHAVSWKHSDRIPAAQLDGTPAWTLRSFVRAMAALGQREFVFVPFFVSAQGAIGSALRDDLEELQRELTAPDAHGPSGRPPFEFAFSASLGADDTLARILVDRVRTACVTRNLNRPPVIVVDHGGPSARSAAVRDRLAAQLRATLAAEVGTVVAASMEGEHPPLLADVLRRPEIAGRDVVVALLFLAPGRHAGPAGDIAQICAEAAAENSATRPHPTELIGTHPAALETLAAALHQSLPTLHVPTPA
jgi:sirohydrochlorin ferrochelatase